MWRQARIDTSLQGIRTWLEERPDVQKGIILEAFARISENDNLWKAESDALMHLYGAAPPADLGLWCLGKSVALAKPKPGVAENLLEIAVRAYRNQSEDDGLPVTVLREMVKMEEALAHKLEQLLSPPPVNFEETEQNREYSKYAEERRQQEAEC